MNHGARSVRIDHRDRDFHKSFGSVDSTTLQKELNLDAGLWVENQELPDNRAPASLPSFSVPAMPYGCTDYAQTDLCMDEDGVELNPFLLEQVTHANANGGGDIRVALKAAIQVFNRTAYYNVKAQGILDWFDAFRVCMASTSTEKRAISIGTPYFREWATTGVDGIAPTPANYSTLGLPWHNWAICGWKIVGDQLMLIGKTWQGESFGDKGFFYVSRTLINNVMSISGTAAYTLSKDTPTTIQTIDVSYIQWIVSLIRNLLGL